MLMISSFQLLPKWLFATSVSPVQLAVITAPSHFRNLAPTSGALVSLSISGFDLHDTEQLALPRLEIFCISKYKDFAPLPIQWWHVPRLRHVYLGGFTSAPNFNTVLISLWPCASQLESLFLNGQPSQPGLPHDFWDSFVSLQFGMSHSPFPGLSPFFSNIPEL